MVDVDLLFVALQVVFTGGAGPISQWLLESWPWFQTKTRKVKMILAVGVSSLIGMSAYTLAVMLRYEAAPADWRGWAGWLFGAAVLSSGLSEWVHRRIKARLLRG